MRIGRWSEFRAVVVVHVILSAMFVVAVVISGEVGCWSIWGILVWVFVFKIFCCEFWIRSAIRFPLWSSVYEFQVVECALTSPMMMLLV